MSLKKPAYFLFSALILASCSESKLPASSRSGSEIIVVCNKTEWDGPVGEAIRETLTQQMQGLPDGEPEFTLVNIPETAFTKIVQTHRNFLVENIAPKYRKSKVETLTNVWSDPQRVIKIHAGSDTAFLNICTQHSEGIRELFTRSERARYSAQNAQNRNSGMEKLLADEFGINMILSKDFHQAKKAKDFVWLVSDSSANSIGLLIYTCPFKDTSQLNREAILAARDVTCQKTHLRASQRL